MDYIFLDMEWNQPGEKADTVTEPVPLYGEIIRIGAVRVDENMHETDRFHCCVIPKYYKKMNSFVGKVTGLSGTAISFGQKFPLAYKYFADWCGEDCIIFTWGGEDEKIMDANLAVHDMQVCHPRFYDLQKIFAHRVMKTGRQYSLMSAVRHFDLPEELKAHDALNDAVYCARVGLSMDFSRFIGGYEDMLREAEEQRQEKYFSTYQNIGSACEAMKNRSITFCACPKCRRIMSRSKWVFCGETTAISCCKCSSHGEYYVRIKMKKCPDGTYAVTKKFARLTEENREFYFRSAHKREANPAAF